MRNGGSNVIDMSSTLMNVTKDSPALVKNRQLASLNLPCKTAMGGVAGIAIGDTVLGGCVLIQLGIVAHEHIQKVEKGAQ
jgi:hypothetical protein